MKGHYTYKLVVTNNDIIVKRFYCNDKNELSERFELWFIKQSYDKENINTYFDFVQHANNK